MLKGELTLERARAIVLGGGIVYAVVSQTEIVKVFDYHREAFAFARLMELSAHNVTHPNCPRFVKFELSKISQFDLFLDLP